MQIFLDKCLQNFDKHTSLGTGGNGAIGFILGCLCVVFDLLFLERFFFFFLQHKNPLFFLLFERDFDPRFLCFLFCVPWLLCLRTLLGSLVFPSEFLWFDTVSTISGSRGFWTLVLCFLCFFSTAFTSILVPEVVIETSKCLNKPLLNFLFKLIEIVYHVN